MAIDTETKDDGLAADRGPGWATGEGHIVGISVATAEQGSVYIPIRHPDTHNFDIPAVRQWLLDHIAAIPTLVFHVAEYDLGWLFADLKIQINKPIEDTQAMAVMLDENRSSYSLDNCCIWQKVPKKDDRLLREAAAAFGVDAKGGLHLMPAKYVGDYAAQDAASTLALYSALLPQLIAENVYSAYRLEMDLVPLTLEMRRRGVRIDTDKCESMQQAMRAKKDETLLKLTYLLSQRRVVTMEDCMSPAWLETVFTDQGITYARTLKTRRGQFKSDWMSKHNHMLPQLVAQARKYNETANKFIGDYILGYVVNNRLHAEIHKLRDDTGGTRSYRFSYSNPPLQQTPIRDPELGPMIRSLFLPEPGCEWGAFDIQGQEPAMTVHYAVQHKAAGYGRAREYYHTTEKPDYHQFVADLMGIPRHPAKIINLSLMYGMGVTEMMARLNMDREECEKLLVVYHAKVPFVKHLSVIYAHQVNKEGFIRLLDGAKCRFDSWEPVMRFPPSEYTIAASYNEAKARWPNAILRRAYTHKVLNRLIQGGSARQIKMIMLECWKDGVVPMLTLHDELDFNIENPNAVSLISRIMTDTVPLNVPTKIDVELGPTWGEAK
jgi:DNA polymerase I-like protein with 3'-5' exonuclease and polymerase domains